MTPSSRFTYVAVAVLGAVVGLGALVAFAQSAHDAWYTGQVYLPRLSRYRPAETVGWQDSVVYLGALIMWCTGGALSLPALQAGPRIGYAAISCFLTGALLFIFSWWHLGLILALVAAALAFVCFVWRVGPSWLPFSLVMLAVGGVVYATAR